MVKKILMFLIRLLLFSSIAIILGLGIPNMIAEWYARARQFQVEQAPSAPVAIVFGAGLTRDGQPSPVLRDRVATAVQLYFDGKVQKILMSGDNRFVDYNEPGAMKRYALSLGVPEADIVLDYAGRRTYDTCYRARHIFGVREAILVTQRFHLPRAIFTCNGLGVDSVGVIADQRTYSQYAHRFWRIREIPATAMAFVDVFITRPLPVLGEPEPIFGVNDESSLQEQAHP
ncbi:SanA/YdcF family protein [Bellilinea sp.]|jgi:SanA protein|uniref:SanA/YdcF family protein n=1 Tax=Bellilinea sp. TaxID=2838785 RepID=UPI002ADDB7BE|nr:ElyC/SanA/YdcF family protein [Bellilinea sp.]